jgi:hypothetical protein
MKTTKIILLLAIIAIPLLQSCKKEDYLTNAEKIGIELDKFINEHSIQGVEARKYYTNSIYDYNFSTTFKIEGSFIKVGESRYSLENLSRYYTESRYIGQTTGICLYLHFN